MFRIHYHPTQKKCAAAVTASQSRCPSQLLELPFFFLFFLDNFVAYLNCPFFDWMAGRGAISFGGQALGAVLNQLVRSRAQLLVAE